MPGEWEPWAVFSWGALFGVVRKRPNLIWGFTKIRDPYIEPHIGGIPCNKDPDKVPLISETLIWWQGSTAARQGLQSSRVYKAGPDPAHQQTCCNKKIGSLLYSYTL